KSPPLARTPWRILVEVQLCLADSRRRPANISKDLHKLLARKHLQLGTLKAVYQERDAHNDLFDFAITACELEVARGGDVADVPPTLRHLSGPESRYWDKLHPHQVEVLDILLRATALLDKIEGRDISADTFLISPPSTEEQQSNAKGAKKPEEP